MSQTFSKSNGNEEGRSKSSLTPGTPAPIFMREQKIAMFIVCALSFAAPFLLDPYIDVLQMEGYLLSVSVVMLGFTMTALSLFIKKADKIMKEEAGTLYHRIMYDPKTDLRGALVKNTKLVITSLLINAILGVILIIFDTCKIEKDSMLLKLLESIVLLSITATFFYAGYLIPRVFEVITRINKKQSD